MQGLKDKIILITGAQVLVIGRTEKTLQESAAQHENISYVVADINKTDDIKKNFRRRKRKISMAEVDKIFAGIFAAFERVEGTIINIGSANASRPMKNMSVYSASS